MNADVAALLEVQNDDLRIYGIEDKLHALMPRVAALEVERKKAEESLVQAKQLVGAEEKRQRDLQDRLRQHRELREKSEGLLGQVTSPREAAAAMAQIEQAKKFVADEERELDTLSHRLTDLRKASAEREKAVSDIERLQQETRTTLDTPSTFRPNRCGPTFKIISRGRGGIFGSGSCSCLRTSITGTPLCCNATTSLAATSVAPGSSDGVQLPRAETYL